MGGCDVDAAVKRCRRKGEDYVRLSDVRRDMQHLLTSLEYMSERAGGFHGNGFLLIDDSAMLQQIADDYGLKWPDKL